MTPPVPTGGPAPSCRATPRLPVRTRPERLRAPASREAVITDAESRQDRCRRMVVLASSGWEPQGYRRLVVDIGPSRPLIATTNRHQHGTAVNTTFTTTTHRRLRAGPGKRNESASPTKADSSSAAPEHGSELERRRSLLAPGAWRRSTQPPLDLAREGPLGSHQADSLSSVGLRYGNDGCACRGQPTIMLRAGFPEGSGMDRP